MFDYFVFSRLTSHCPQVRSLVCIKENGEYGTLLPSKKFLPTPKTADDEKEGGGSFCGWGGTLVLLHELRVHRMSHFQLLRL